MGTIFSSREKVTPSRITDFHERYQRPNSELSEDDIRCKRRSTTDICFLLFFAIILIVLLCLIGYCIFNGDIYRVINGYDNCGYVCGRPRPRGFQQQKGRCSGYSGGTSEKYHIVLKDPTLKTARFCVADCSAYEGYRTFFNRCIPNKITTAGDNFFSKTGLKNFFSEVSEDFHLCWKEFLYLCLISLVFSITILALFRYFVGYVVWIVLIGTVLACVCGTTFLWIIWKQARDSTTSITSDFLVTIDVRKTETYLAFAILATLVTVIVILIVVVMRKRIKLVVQLFQESGKALAVMPSLLFEPILTFLCLGAVVFLGFYFCLCIESAGKLTELNSGVYYYEKDIAMKVTQWYNLFSMLWVAQFIIGCQQMVIAGAVSKWYFTRDKSRIDSPITHSFYNLTRYHLGSVALGSFLTATVQFARVMLMVLEKFLKGRQGRCIECLLKCCHCCLYCFEKILKYLNRNAYIEVAIYGYPFCRAGKQAFKQLSSNVFSVTAINSVGDFVLFLGKVIVVMATVLIGVKMLQNKDGVQHMWVPLTLAGVFAYFVAHCFITVYEMAIDTIFICFCEDCEENDGLSKPYYMSRGLMEFVENSKKALDFHDSRTNRGNAFEAEIRTVDNGSNAKT